MNAGAGLLTGYSKSAQWAALLVLSLLLVVFAQALHLPAALMVGPMLAAIAIATSNATIRVPTGPVIAIQGIIGCLMGRSIPLTFLDDLALQWPLLLLGLGGVIAAATAIGWQLTKWRILPGTTGIWGTSPGASTPMILMSEAYGGDPRLVAVMQKMRIMMVVAVAALVARIWTPSAATHMAAVEWFPPVAWGSLLATMALALGSAWLAARLRIPAGSMLVPLILAIVLQGLGWLTIELPPWLLAASYAFVGWSIGLSFNRPILRYALRMLPLIAASTALLIAACALLGGVMVVIGGIDPLTAYLATSPGGADSIAIIAASSPVDMRFVMAMQTTRLVVVLLVAPSLSRFVARRAGS